MATFLQGDQDMGGEYSAADLIVETLGESGVDVIFGVPSDGLSGFLAALERRRDRIRFIAARQEQAAAFMACAYAKWTGRLGCCMAGHSAAGVGLLNGLFDAAHDGAPVIALTGQPEAERRHTSADADIDLLRLFRNVAVHSAGVAAVEHAHTAVSLACRIARTRQGVAHLAVPESVQLESADHVRNRVRVSEPSAEPRARLVPSARDIEAAADVLNRATRVAILAGQGVAGAEQELLRTAEILGAPVTTALLGRAAVPGDHPCVVGGIGPLGADASQLALAACDVLLIVGSSCPWVEYYPMPSQVRTVQIDNDRTRIGLRFPVDAGVAGDAAESLRALNAVLVHKKDRGFLEDVQNRKRQWLDALETHTNGDAEVLPVLRVIRELDQRLAPDALITTDSGPHTPVTAQYLHVTREQQFSIAGSLGAAGGGLPYAIAAAVACPRRQVVAVVADESLAASAAELETCARYQLPVTVVVLNDQSARAHWEPIATGFGVRGFTVDNPSTIGTVLDAALSHHGPALVDAVVDVPRAALEDQSHGSHQTDRHRQSPGQGGVRLLA
ncbi:MAG: thiamine pyrophosphate-binding protein [Vicinamibacterales bacterium]